MKKLIAVIAAAVLVATPVFAFEGKGKGGFDPEKRLERLTEKLSLTPDQVARIRAIHESKRAKFEALAEETKNEVRAILTPEQQAKFDKMKEKMKEKWSEKKEHHKEVHEEKLAEE